MELPERIRRHIAGKPYVRDDIGKSGSSILLFEDMVLKIEPDGEEAQNAAAVMAWLSGRLSAPDLLEREIRDGTSYLLMTRVRGEMACSPRYMNNPGELIPLLADALHAMWSIDTGDCPVRNGLDEKLRMARCNVERGLVDMGSAEPDTFGPGGFASPEHLLRWLEGNRPPERLVFSHGDFCLPNIFFDQGRLTGLIDLGRAGAADPWQDIALCCRSLLHNADGRYGVRYDGFSQQLLFDALGLKPDDEKMRYYLLLDELF
ncbi:MAG: aminoglycoside 3'-phosphotransferase [Clostridia bacterium]|nr:aminoglycoside 3'-phosphotransferase [Clostridia bacterium]